MKPIEVVKILEKNGWIKQKQGKSSHVKFKHPDRPMDLVVVAMHPMDIPEGTLRRIEKQSGIKMH